MDKDWIIVYKKDGKLQRDIMSGSLKFMAIMTHVDYLKSLKLKVFGVSSAGDFIGFF